MLKGKKLALYLLIILALAFNARAVYSPDQYTVALWHLDECEGNIASDATGNGNTGTLNNVEWTTEGYLGCAGIFNGVDSKISAIKAPSLDITEQVTVEAWIKRFSNQDGTIFSRNGPFAIAVDDNKAVGAVHTSGGAEGWAGAIGTSNLDIGVWYHIAMTYDGSRVRIFVNGIEENSAPKTGIMVVRSQAPFIGWGEPGQNQYFHGIIDEVRISNISRTSFDVPTTTTTILDVYTKQEVDALLAERDSKIIALESRASLLETALSNIRSTLTTLENTVSNLFINLFGLPKGLREQMVCDAMKATNQTSVTGFGLTCSLNDKGSCSCS